MVTVVGVLVCCHSPGCETDDKCGEGLSGNYVPRWSFNVDVAFPVYRCLISDDELDFDPCMLPWPQFGSSPPCPHICATTLLNSVTL